LTAGVNMSARATVERAVNEARMAAFFVIFTTVVGVGMTVGFATCAWLGVLAAVLTFAATALVIAAVSRVRVVRHVAMELMHRITGQ
jgi:fatty acid desaturase